MRMVELQEIGDRACFVPFGAFHRSLDLSWLKPFVLLADYVVFESRATLHLYVNSLTFREPEILHWLEDRSLFLDSVRGVPSRRRVVEELQERFESVALKSDGTFNRTFLKTFYRRMELREEGAASDFSDRYGLRDQGDRYTVVDWHTWRVLLDELVDAYYGSFVLSRATIQPVVDPLEEWLLRRVLRQDCGSTYLRTFRNACLTAIPDFVALPWKAVVALSESKWREPCLEHFRSMGSEPNPRTRQAVSDALWRLATEVASEGSIGKAVLRGVLGNLPGLPINPFGLGQAARDLRSVHKRNKEYGWLFLLQEMRQKASYPRHRERAPPAKTTLSLSSNSD